MKMTKRRSDCTDCKAYQEFPRRSCQLGYPIEFRSWGVAGVSMPYPTESCPKPKTGSDWYEASRDFDTWGHKTD